MSARYSANQLAALLGDARPTPQQAAAIEAPPSPLLIVAGAGSGKTTTMAARVVWLIANGFARPDQILGLTFTRKAAGELARKIRQRLSRLAAHPDSPPLAGEPSVSTYHSYASGIVTEHGLRAGVEPGGTVLSGARAWQLGYAAASGYDGDMSAVTLGFDEVVRRTLSLSDELAEHLRDGEELRTFTRQLREDIGERIGKGTKKTDELLLKLESRLQLLPLVDEYARRKRELSAVDYADQLALAARVASVSAEVGRIERQRFPIVLLDEYQDTSHSQVTLLRELFGGGHPVTAVGDPCQSIYAWRGASSGTLSRFATEFPDLAGEPASRVELTTSWRNRAAVLTVANAVSEPLRTAGLQVSELEPGIDGDGHVIAALLETVDDESDWIAEEISARWTAQAEQPPSTAVLVRRRSQIARLEQALRDKGLPVEVVGLGGLLDAPEVREIYATLTVLARPTSGSALMRLLTGPRWRIGPRDIAALHGRARELAPARRGYEPSADGLTEVTLAEALDDPGEAELYSAAAFARFTRLRAELTALRSRADQPIDDLIAEIARVSGLGIEVAVHQRDTERLDAFTDIASQYAATATMPSLDGFLSYLDAAEERERGLEITGATERSGAVQIMTVHAAKGLEWDLVAVPGLCKDVFPGKPRDANWLTATGKLPYPLRGDAQELPRFLLGEVTSAAKLTTAIGEFGKALAAQHETEERRLAYVALTRARFTALASGYWWDTAAAGARGPSRFLSQIREAGARTAQWAPEPAGPDNPLLAEDVHASWPIAQPLGARQEAMTAAAVAVRESDGVVPESGQAARWTNEVELLLAERDAGVSDGIDVPVPRQLSVSQLVAWHDDAQEFARRLRRPVPEPPAPHTRRGTAFHAWVERHFGGEALFDLDELPGAADAEAEDDEALQELCDAFASSQWASRVPVALEVPFATVLRSVVVRGRMDAVFATEGGGFEVVDWKTGRPPHGKAAQAAAVQLAAYRQAWAALRGIEVSQVGAAFHYVRQNLTVRPRDLPDLAALAEPLRTA